VVTSITTGVRSTNPTRRCRCACARIDALITVARLVGRAIAVTAAFPSAAPHQRIAEISRPAEANGAVVSSRISALFAISIDAARIRAAQFTFIEWPAAFERVSGVAFGAAADCFVVLDVADGAHSAHSRARIGALEIETGLVFGALLVLRALWIAALERIAQEIGRARTHGAVIQNAAVGVDTARRARIAAAEVDAGLVVAALGVPLALVTAAVQRVAEESVQAGTHDTGGLFAASGVLAAGTGRAQVVT